MNRALRHLVFFSPFVFPLYLIRFQVGGIPFTLTEVFFYGLFGLWFFSGGWKRPTHAIGFLIGMLLVVAGATVGLFGAPSEVAQTALGVWKGWVMAPALYFMTLLGTLKDHEDAEKLLRRFVLAAGLLAFVSYLLALRGSGLTYDVRLSGPFESANYLALFLAPAVLAGAWFFTQPKKDLWNAAATAAAWHALVFTQSYAALVGVFGAAGLWVLYAIAKHPRGRRPLIVAGVGLVAALVLGVAVAWNTPKFQQFLDFKGRSSTTVRLEVYQIATALVRENPWRGVGPGLFQPYYEARGPWILGRAPLEWHIPHPHNLILAFWLNAGLLGLLGLILIIVLALRKFTPAWPAFLVLLIHGLFDTPFWKNDLAPLFWLLIACIALYQSHATHTPQSAEAHGRRKPKRGFKKRS